MLYVLYVLNLVWQCGGDDDDDDDDGDDGEGFVCIDGNGVDEGRMCWSAGAGGRTASRSSDRRGTVRELKALEEGFET